MSHRGCETFVTLSTEKHQMETKAFLQALKRDHEAQMNKNKLMAQKKYHYIMLS